MRTRHILVVDDDPAIGQMLTMALARHGFAVDATTSADDALEKCGKVSYDAALLKLDPAKAEELAKAFDEL